MHGHAAEPLKLHLHALAIEDEAALHQLLQGHSHSWRAGALLELSGSRVVSLQFRARSDRLIVIAALLMLLPLYPHVCSLLLVLSLRRSLAGDSCCCRRNNLQHPCHHLYVLSAVPALFQLTLSIIPAKKTLPWLCRRYLG